MPIKDPVRKKEYARLSMLIKYARERGENTNELLSQRKKLIANKSIIQKGIIDKNIIPKKEYNTGYNKTEKNNQLLKQISTQLEELLNLVKEQKNYSDLFTKIQENQQTFFQQIENLLTEKFTIVNKVRKESKSETKTEKTPPQKTVTQQKDQIIKIDTAELEKETGIKKDWTSSVWKKAWKNKYNELYNKLPSTIEKKRVWEEKQRSIRENNPK